MFMSNMKWWHLYFENLTYPSLKKYASSINPVSTGVHNKRSLSSGWSPFYTSRWYLSCVHALDMLRQNFVDTPSYIECTKLEWWAFKNWVLCVNTHETLRKDDRQTDIQPLTLILVRTYGGQMADKNFYRLRRRMSDLNSNMKSDSQQDS